MRVSLTVNGAIVSADAEPRLQLADFLREHCLLTGTHIGCEHGVCGACTILLDGAPARSCIAYAAACQDADVRTIEGLDDDPITRRLRAAFTTEHALQCGYCTPGMLVTARDIVLRLPDADEARIRLELAGNLCRCTGYAGIVRAIRRVLGDEASAADPTVPAEAARWEKDARPPLAGLDREADQGRGEGEHPSPSAPVTLTLVLNRPREDVWAALQDPALLATCVPGARLLRAEGGEIEGDVRVSLGPIAAVFAGTGTLALDPAAYRAVLSGSGRDARSGTLLSGTATITLEAIDSTATRAVTELRFSLRGPLAQLARGPIIEALAASIADTVARNLEQRLGGSAAVLAGERLSLGALILHAIRAWVRRRLHR